MKTKFSTTLKIVSMLLCLLMVFYEIPLGAISAFATADTAAEEEYENDTDILCEDVSKRDENTKYFLMRDGTYTAAVYNEPVHFLDSDGVWQEYDNSLSETDALLPDMREYYPNASDMDIKLSKKAKSNKMITLEDIDLSWGYADTNNSTAYIKDTAGNDVEYKNKNLAAMAIKNANGIVIYPEIYTDTDLEVCISSSGVKENLILGSAASPHTFTLEYKTDGTLTPVQKDERTVALTDADGNELYFVSAPYMIDSQGESSSAVMLTLTETKNKKFTLDISADSTWLSSADRVYPVTVDPAFVYKPSSAEESYETNAVMLNYVPSEFTDRSENAYAKIGTKYTSAGRNAEVLTLTKHTLPSQITSTDRIISAEIYLWYYTSIVDSVFCSVDMQINAYRIISDWNASGYNNVYNATNLPTYDDTVLDFAIANEATVDRTDASTCYEAFNITEAAQGWLDGTCENYGVLFRADDPPTYDCYVRFLTGRHPRDTLNPAFVYNYRDTKGLESYWSYYSFGAGRNGTAYVNNYSGDLVKTEPLFSSGGSRNPYSVTLTYTGAYARTNITNSYGAGYGWMLDGQQRIENVTDTVLTDAGYDYIWLDGDGTEHYFRRNTPEEGEWTEADGWVDEDGMSLELTRDTQYIYLTSESGYELCFYLPSAGGALRHAKDNYGNTTQYNYTTISGVTGQVLTSIVSASGRTTTLEYTVVGTGSTAYAQLTSMTDPSGREYTFTYTDTHYLNKITYPDGTTSTYYYYHGRLAQFVAYKKRIQVTYTQNEQTGIFRVANISEFAWSTAEQKYVEGTNSIDFAYLGANVTTITDAQGRTTQYVFDNAGRATSVTAPDGSVANVTYTQSASLANSAYASSVMSNKLTGAAASPAYINNLLRDPNMEKDGSYTGYDLSGGSYSVDTAKSYLGYKSLKLSNSGNAPASSVYRQTIDVSDRTTEYLTVSAYITTDGVESAAAGGVCFELICYDADGNIIDTYYSARPLKGDSDWHRRSYTFTLPTGTDSVSVGFALINAVGTVWYDCAQAEYGKTANTLNLLEDSGFDREGTWLYNNLTSEDSPSGSGSSVLTGNGFANKYVYQYIDVGRSDVCFTLLARAEADAVSNPSAEALLEAEIRYEDGTFEWQKTSFNAYCANSEQQIILNVKPKREGETVEWVGFFLIYRNNANTMSVTEVMISVDESGTSYTYDADGNLTSAADNAERNQEYDYNEVGEVTKYTDEKKNNYHYIYNESNEHQLDTMYSESTGAGFSFVYDSYGNVTGVSSGEYSEENSALDILTSTTYTYTASGEFVTGIIDARGLNTVYAVNETTGLTESITTPATLLGVDKNVITKYTYDIGNHNLLTSGIYSSDDPNTLISGVTYTYNNPLAQLKDITRTDGQKYSFTYDIWGRVTDIKVGNKLLSHSVYRKASSDTQLAYTEYGNGDRVYYTYDGLDRIIALSTAEGGTPYVTYDYNSEGLVGRVTDNLSGVTTEYHYDLLGRLVSSTLSQGGIDRYFYTYNESNQLTSVSAYLPTGELVVTCVYTYGEDGRLASVTEGEYTVHYTYDVLSRVTCERTVHEDGAEYYVYFSYLEADNGNTTSFVETVTYKTKAVGATAETVVGSIHYTYDKNGFISSVTEKDANGNSTSSESYTYDALGQLKTVTRGSNVTEYTYDNSGNILSKKVNGTVVGTYTYTDSQWKDLLTAYNGETITYDGIGNPIHYLGNSTMTWDMGRRLTDYESADVNVSYVYDASGQRIEKHNGDVVTKFYYDDRGVLVLSSRSDGTELRFYADANGNIDSFSYNNEQYYYVRNAQNDIIGITDSTGAFVARYTYDEWGNITSITDGQGNDVSANQSHIANINPLRYRSYFYDAETGFYWLNTRYYDPAIGRFINADVYLSTGQGVIGHNMYAYCGNNPINAIDTNGQLFGWLGLGVFVGVALLLSGCSDNDTASDVGAARPYSPSDSTDYNCYAYAMGEDEWKYVGGTPNAVKDFNVDSVAKMVLEDAKNDGRSMRIIESYDSPINDNEYRVALRTGKEDYHFMVQHDDGSWSHKPGFLSTRLIDGDNPSVVSWDQPTCNSFLLTYFGIIKENGATRNYYDSDTIYFAVESR